MPQSPAELRVVTNPVLHRRYFRVLEGLLTKGKGVQTFHRRPIKAQRAKYYKVCWHPEVQVAFVFNELSEWKGHHPYWVGIGLEKPDAAPRQLGPIPTQFNTPHPSNAGGFAGAFLQDSAGKIHLGHTGRLRKFAAKELLSVYPGPRIEAERPDGGRKTYLLIDALDSARLLWNLRDFAQFVQDFKANRLARTFTALLGPEFAGKVHVKGTPAHDANYTHGYVFRALTAELRSRLEPKGFKVQRTQLEDIVVRTKAGRVCMLFEVKPSLNPYSIYTGVGQLFYHGVQYDDSCQRVLVLPNAVTVKTKAVLASLGLSVLQYTGKKGSYRFPKLGSVL